MNTKTLDYYQQGAARIKFDGVNFTPALAGLSVVEFANEKRLQILLEKCNVPKLAIECTTPTAIKNGILIVGSNKAIFPKVLTTNGRIWLQGDHTGSPLLIASSELVWTLSSTAFLPEAEPQAVTLQWKVCLVSTCQRTIFTSPQNCTLTLNGTLIPYGVLEGNLKKIVIQSCPEMQTLNAYIPKIQILSQIQYHEE